MKTGKEIKSRFYAMNPALRYLPDGDRYLFEFEPPRHKFAIIGSGIIGQEHLRVTAMEGRAEVHGIYDPNPTSVDVARDVFEQYYPEKTPVVYDSLEQACHDPETDGLILCTPNYTHIEIVREAAKSGKHILLEKPMATTLEDAYEILGIAQRYKAVFQMRRPMKRSIARCWGIYA